MEDAQYVAQISQRTTQLDLRASKIKDAQEHSVRQRVIEKSAFSEEINTLLLAVEQTEHELSELAKVTKKLIINLQYAGMQSQLSVLHERADMLAIEHWVTKKELKRIFEKK